VQAKYDPYAMWQDGVKVKTGQTPRKEGGCAPTVRYVCVAGMKEGRKGASVMINPKMI